MSDRLGEIYSIWVFSKIGVPLKWMVKIMENPIKHGMIWGDFTHYFRKHPYLFLHENHKNQPFHVGKYMQVYHGSLYMMYDLPWYHVETTLRCFVYICFQQLGDAPDSDSEIRKRRVSAVRGFRPKKPQVSKVKFRREQFRIHR